MRAGRIMRASFGETAAATRDDELWYQAASAMSDATRAKHHDYAGKHGGASARYYGLDRWSPDVNIFRDPRRGRGRRSRATLYLARERARGVRRSARSADSSECHRTRTNVKRCGPPALPFRTGVRTVEAVASTIGIGGGFPRAASTVTFRFDSPIVNPTYTHTLPEVVSPRWSSDPGRTPCRMCRKAALGTSDLLSVIQKRIKRTVIPRSICQSHPFRCLTATHGG